MVSVPLSEGMRHKTPPRSIWMFLQHCNNQMNKLLIDIQSNGPDLSAHGNNACNRLSQDLHSKRTHRHVSEEVNKNMKKKVKLMIGAGVKVCPLLPTDNEDAILSNLCKENNYFHVRSASGPVRLALRTSCPIARARRRRPAGPRGSGP